MNEAKQETISFKVDAAMAEALRQHPNRSEFIREALKSALDQLCPLCGGGGILTSQQRQRWEEFMAHHRLRRGRNGHFLDLECDTESR